jgi:hypothetical protein
LSTPASRFPNHFETAKNIANQALEAIVKGGLAYVIVTPFKSA